MDWGIACRSRFWLVDYLNHAIIIFNQSIRITTQLLHHTNVVNLYLMVQSPSWNKKGKRCIIKWHYLSRSRIFSSYNTQIISAIICQRFRFNLTHLEEESLSKNVTWCSQIEEYQMKSLSDVVSFQNLHFTFMRLVSSQHNSPVNSVKTKCYIFFHVGYLSTQDICPSRLLISLLRSSLSRNNTVPPPILSHQMKVVICGWVSCFASSNQ